MRNSYVLACGLIETVYDVIVSGAGPSGTLAAWECAKAGLCTLLLERYRIPREKCCAGGLLQRAIDRLPYPLPEEVIEREIFGFTVQVGEERKEFSFSRRAGVVVRRQRLDGFLARNAEKAGADVLENNRALKIVEGRDHVLVKTIRGDFEGRFLIVAEGATSRAGRMLFGPYPREHLAMGMAVDLELSNDPGGNIEIHLLDTPTHRLSPRSIFPLNGWVFPHAYGANLGVVGKGVQRSRMEDSVMIIRRRLEARCGPCVDEGDLSAHPLPFVPRRRLHTGRSLAVGDAAGLVNPITREGMSYAFLSGRIAAQVVREQIRSSNGRPDLSPYASWVADAIAQDLKAAMVLSPILHRLMGVVDTKRFFEVVRDDQILIEACLAIARGEENWRLLLRRIIPRFPRLFFSSLS
jgi:geranylgeranyl reductase family protein